MPVIYREQQLLWSCSKNFTDTVEAVAIVSVNDTTCIVVTVGQRQLTSCMLIRKSSSNLAAEATEEV